MAIQPLCHSITIGARGESSGVTYLQRVTARRFLGNAAAQRRLEVRQDEDRIAASKTIRRSRSKAR
jgi:hypothetical protein